MTSTSHVDLRTRNPERSWRFAVLLAVGLLINRGQAQPAASTSNPVARPNPPVAVPVGVAGARLTADQANSALTQFQTLSAQLVEERRLALLQAAALNDPAAKQKVLTDLEASQKARLVQLRQFRAQVFEYNQGRSPTEWVRPIAPAP